METLLIYIVKASGILSLFYLTHQLFLKKETFYAINRHFLIAGIATALLFPFVTITNYIEFHPIPLNTSSGYDALVPTKNWVQDIHWKDILFAIYVTGVLVCSSKFVVQLLSLYKLINNSTIVAHDKHFLVETDKSMAPFSFFNYIFYNPRLYSPNELSAVLKHEKAHSSQWHSLDVLLSHLVAIFTWFNPFSWLYRSNIKQNLEFLADESATKEIASVKKYQYTLLKVSGNHMFTPIVNNFYNSLIKKRIVMLNKSKSNKRNILKVALIIPALAVFLVSFNTKDVYVPTNPSLDSPSIIGQNSQRIAITIDKNTTDEELIELKKDLATKGIDFSYTVVHNSNNEIIDISVDFATTTDDGKKIRSSSNFNNGDEGIDPVHIIYDKKTNSISMGSNVGVHVDMIEDEDVDIKLDKASDKVVWITSDGAKDEHRTIEIIDKNGKETIKVNGKEVSRKEYETIKAKDGIHEKHIKIRKSDIDEGENIFIMKMSDDDDIDVDMDIIATEEGESKKMFLIKTEEDKKPLFVIDGKNSKEKDMKKLEPSDIESINVLKGEMATKKYGKKGKNGVVEITTKKE